MVCDLTIAADNAIFGQTGPKVALPSSVSLMICRLRVLIVVWIGSSMGSSYDSVELSLDWKYSYKSRLIV